MGQDRNPVAYVSQIFFDLDMTRPSRGAIPLGIIIEAFWPDRARWLGLIGRTGLTDIELNDINLQTWPELRQPFEFLESLFNEGWEGEWGSVASIISKKMAHSALRIDTRDESKLLDLQSIDDEVAWVTTTGLLRSHLERYGLNLEPRKIPPLYGNWVPRPVLSRLSPKGTKTYEGFKAAA